MCGIAGVFEYARADGGVNEAVLTAMRETIHHRGPDGAGLFVSPDHRVGLAHRRLAIVDLEGGSQPMYGRRGEVLVFNGEIYNYPELRRRLLADGVQFDTTCDTEVILRLYERHGDACVEHLNGMFAFALWDPNRKQLLVARDRLGEKPFYWADRDGRMVFGSEIKAVLAHPAVPAAVNDDAIAGYLANYVSSSPATLYAGINKLPPGTLAICDSDGVRVRRYWNLSEPRRFSDDPLDVATRRVRELLDKSVQDRLMADVPVGVLLSGGLDSTTLVALLQERAKGLASFSVGFSGDTVIDEREEARRVAHHFGTDHHEIEIGEEDALAFLPDLVYHQDEPLADPVCIPLSFVCGLARKAGVPVVLAGEGADELFWGYPRYREIMTRWKAVSLALRAPQSLRRMAAGAVPARRKPRLRDFLDTVADGRLWPLHYPLGLSSHDRRVVLGRENVGTWTRLDGTVPPASTPLETLAFDTQEYEFELRLPELLLMRIDRFSMAHSVESRVPFLDPELVEYVYRLPMSHKLHDGVTKVVLKQAIADVVPEWVINRKKQGFGAPISDWLFSKMGRVLPELMQGEGLRAHFDTAGLATVLHDHQSGKANNEWILWPILNFALWHRYWIEGKELEPLVDRLGRVA